jgi:hypothetical protein
MPTWRSKRIARDPSDAAAKRAWQPRARPAAGGHGRSRPLTFVAVLAVLVLCAAVAGEAQRRRDPRSQRSGGFGVEAGRLSPPRSYDGQFNFCRVAFRGYRGSSWAVDYPQADQNVMVRLAELTKTTISRTPGGQPNHVIVQLSDPELFDCPLVMMTEPGNLYLDDVEVAQLRAYTAKGGFLWADDFWGEYAWDVWAEQLAKALPPGQFTP